jgi:hypothetical protein
MGASKPVRGSSSREVDAADVDELVAGAAVVALDDEVLLLLVADELLLDDVLELAGGAVWVSVGALLLLCDGFVVCGLAPAPAPAPEVLPPLVLGLLSPAPANGSWYWSSPAPWA